MEYLRWSYMWYTRTQSWLAPTETIPTEQVSVYIASWNLFFLDFAKAWAQYLKWKTTLDTGREELSFLQFTAIYLVSTMSSLNRDIGKYVWDY